MQQGESINFAVFEEKSQVLRVIETGVDRSNISGEEAKKSRRGKK